MIESASEMEQDEEILQNLRRELQVREDQTLSMQNMIKQLKNELSKHDSKNSLLLDQIKLLKQSLDKKENALKQELKSKEISFSKLQSLEAENEKLKSILGISMDQSKDSLLGSFWKKINPLGPKIQGQAYSGIQTSNMQLNK